MKPPMRRIKELAEGCLMALETALITDEAERKIIVDGLQQIQRIAAREVTS